MKLIAAAAVGLALLAPRVARADDARIADLQDAVHGLEDRATAIRARAAKAHSSILEHECDRVVKVVDRERVFLATRLEIFHLTGGNPPADLVTQTAERAERADKLLTLVERWFVAR